MGKIFRLGALAALTAFMAVGCGVHQSATQDVTGPSEFALSLNLTATPDSIQLDGSASAIAIEAHHADGTPWVGLPVRLDIVVGNTVQDCGVLSTHNVVTGNDGRAVAIYTAPGLPLPFPQCSGFNPGGTVTIVATPSGTNFQTANVRTADIRLMPTGTIVPPANSPTAAFTESPLPATTGTPLHFDGSTSKPGTGASQIASYSWSFGDAASAAGVAPTHTYSSPGNYNVTLTVTNDRGLAASTTQVVSVVAGLAPTPAFVFSPSGPSVGQTVVFNATTATAAPGHTLTQYNWIFGDGGTASGVVVSHAFTAVGTYNVTLSVVDDTGQPSTTSQSVTVSAGGGNAGVAKAAFTFSPSSPNAGQSVSFNASTSAASGGQSITTYAWDFGDGTSGLGVTVNHVFIAAGTFTVTLTVTDSGGQKGTLPLTVPVQAAGSGSLTAAFTFSPILPVSGQLVSFNASPSTPQGSITSYDWDFGDGTIVNGQSSFIINHTFFTAVPTGSTFVVRLTVHDNTGRSATATPQNVPVSPSAPAIPSFTVSPSPATLATQPVTVTITSPGPVTSANWSFGDGTAVVTTLGAQNTTTTHSYSATGSYVISLTVTDANGQTNSTTRTLVVQ